MRLIDVPDRQKPSKPTHPRWWNSPPSESYELLQEMKLERLKSSVQAHSQPAAQPATQPSPAPLSEQQLSSGELYRKALPVLVSYHNESLLNPVRNQVQALRGYGLNIYAVEHLSPLHRVIVGQLEACFAIGNHVWIDCSQVRRFAATAGISYESGMEGALFHESAHGGGCEDEIDAWIGGFKLWEKFGSCPISDLRSLCVVALKSHQILH